MKSCNVLTKYYHPRLRPIISTNISFFFFFQQPLLELADATPTPLQDEPSSSIVEALEPPPAVAAATDDADDVVAPTTKEQSVVAPSIPLFSQFAQEEEEQQSERGLPPVPALPQSPKEGHYSARGSPRESPFEFGDVPSSTVGDFTTVSAYLNATNLATITLAPNDLAAADNPFAAQKEPLAPAPTAAASQVPPPARMERSFTLHSAASDRKLPRVIEEDEDRLRHDLDDDEDDEHMSQVRTSSDVDVRLALKLDVIAGPRMKTSYVTGEDTTEMSIGRLPDNDLVIPDGEVSGRHVEISWSTQQRCWQIVELGSLNGTQLNGESISGLNRERGEQYRLCTDDIILLGTATKLKVSVFPREMLPENSFDRSLSLSLGPGSLPRSLTMPKHRIPSFTSLLTPKINSPSKQAVVAAASDELRLECCIASATGRDHARRNQLCEDVALAECPLHGSDLALGSDAPAALFCIFDGHCGRNAAEAASVALPDEVSERLQTPEGAAALREARHSSSNTNYTNNSKQKGARDLLHDAFLATDDRINSEEGCTATAVLAWRGANGAVQLQCANVGDSAALLINPENGSYKLLTEDHRLTNPAERERLTRNGIPLHSDSKRLYGLNLARALGDKFLKDEDLGLSAEPAVSDVVSIPHNQGALLLVASDGLWDVMDPEKVAHAAKVADKEHDGSVVEVAAAIVAAAKKAGTRDDVTALVVRLWPGVEWELRSPLMTLDDGQTASFFAP
jgi:protein phosphatase